MLECYDERNFNKYQTHFIFGYLTIFNVNLKNIKAKDITIPALQYYLLYLIAK